MTKSKLGKTNSYVGDLILKWPVLQGRGWVKPLPRGGSDGCQMGARIIDDDGPSRFGEH